MLLLAQRTDLRRIWLGPLGTSRTSCCRWTTSGTPSPSRLRPAGGYGHPYWTDDEVRAIRKAYLGGSGAEHWSTPRSMTLTASRLTGWPATSIGPTPAPTREGGAQRPPQILVSEDLDEPRAIVLHPVMGVRLGRGPLGSRLRGPGVHGAFSPSGGLDVCFRRACLSNELPGDGLIWEPD